MGGQGETWKRLLSNWLAGTASTAAHVADGFKPSQYDADLTMNDSAQSVALASGVSLGAGRVMIQNLGSTGLGVRFAFGTSAANAEANLTHSTDHATTGIQIEPLVDHYSPLVLGVPALATHYALENDTAAQTPTVNVIQGV